MPERRFSDTTLNPTIGCIVLTDPVFFEQEDWVELPREGFDTGYLPITQDHRVEVSGRIREAFENGRETASGVANC